MITEFERKFEFQNNPFGFLRFENPFFKNY